MMRDEDREWIERFKALARRRAQEKAQEHYEDCQCPECDIACTECGTRYSAYGCACDDDSNEANWR